VPLLVFDLTQTLFMMAIKVRHSRQRISIVTRIKVIIISVGSVIGIACYIILCAVVDPESFSISPSIHLFFKLYLASLIGSICVARLLRSAIEWHMLAPCELTARVAEIAVERNVKMQEVRVLGAGSFMASNAVAYSALGIALGEDLLRDLTKSEVDAVIEHEIAHSADDSIWTFRYPLRAAGWLSLIAAALIVQKSVEGFHWVESAIWMMLFVLPPLASRWYSRLSERKANRIVAAHTASQAAISGFYKIHALNNLPTSRPWWSRLVATHQCLDEEMAQFARQSEMTKVDIDKICRQADVELASGYGDHYAPRFYENIALSLMRRPSPIAYTLIVMASVALTVFFLSRCSTLIGNSLDGELWIVPLGIGTILLSTVPIILYSSYSARNLSKRATSLLTAKYSVPEVQALLFDAMFTADADEETWQAALLTIADGKLNVLGEARCVEISLDTKVRITGWANPHHVANREHGVTIWYEVQGITQWVNLRPLGKPDRGLPRSHKELEKFIQKMIVNEGAVLAEADELGPEKRGGLPWSWRVPTAIVMMAGIVILTFVVLRLSDKRDSLGYYSLAFFALCFIWSSLRSWMRAAGRAHNIKAKRPSEADE
jgi:Zn-dependent protease with chaperone function